MITLAFCRAAHAYKKVDKPIISTIPVSITFTNVTPTTWTYIIRDALNANVQNGTASYAAGQYSFARLAGSLPALTMSNSIGIAPAAGANHVSIASTGLPQSNIRFSSAPPMQLDATAGNVHDVGFTLYDVDGQAHNYNMRITSTGALTAS